MMLGAILQSPQVLVCAMALRAVILALPMPLIPLKEGAVAEYSFELL